MTYLLYRSICLSKGQWFCWTCGFHPITRHILFPIKRFSYKPQSLHCAYYIHDQLWRTEKYCEFNPWTTARTARFSKKSPWSVFFRGEMSVICHKITVKCRWNHCETFTAKINKLGPKCRWNILIAGDNTAAKIIRVYTYM